MFFLLWKYSYNKKMQQVKKQQVVGYCIILRDIFRWAGLLELFYTIEKS